jgi:hypothetical protein
MAPRDKSARAEYNRKYYAANRSKRIRKLVPRLANRQQESPPLSLSRKNSQPNRQRQPLPQLDKCAHDVCNHYPTTL